jgi:hypothetical protein
MKHTKDTLSELTKDELLKLASESNKPVNNSYGIPKLISIILTHQATNAPEEITVLQKSELEKGLERIAKLEKMYSDKLLALDVQQGLQPSEETLKKYSKEEAEYQSVQLRLKERKKLPRVKQIQELKKEVNALVRVNISEINPSQEAKDIDNAYYTVSWGNTAIGMHHTKVPLNTDWHIPVGCYRNLQQATLTSSLQPKKGSTIAVFSKPRKRFDVRILDPLTSEEIADIAKQQALLQTTGMTV